MCIRDRCYTTMHIDQRVGQSIGWPGDDYLLPPLWSRNFGQISQQGIFMWFTEELVQRPKMLFPTVFLRDGIWLGEKNEMSITGSLGGVWRAAAVYAVQRMVERPQNDTRMDGGTFGSIQIDIKSLNDACTRSLCLRQQLWHGNIQSPCT